MSSSSLRALHLFELDTHYWVAEALPLVLHLRHLTVRHEDMEFTFRSTLARIFPAHFREQFPTRPQMGQLEVLCIGRSGWMPDLLAYDVDLPRLHTLMLAGPTVDGLTLRRFVSLFIQACSAYLMEYLR